MHRWTNALGTEVFFNSSQGLVQEDANGTQDVYEWAALGTPSCPVATSVYGGCVFLLSGGETEDYSFFVDSDASGANAFFTHRGPLGGVGPADSKNRLYDVRADGGTESRIAVGCTNAAACLASSGQVFAPPPPGSAGISGSDNFSSLSQVKKGKAAAPVKKKKCSKGTKLKHDRCVKAKPKHKQKSHKGGK